MNKVLLFLLLIFSTYSQTLKGTVSDSLGVVPFATILIKKLANPTLVFQYTTANENGIFSIELKEKRQLLFVEISSFSHETFLLDFKEYDSNNQVDVSVFLKPKINSLKDVVITRKKAIQIGKDTTFFNPNSFKDGTERVVEDLLKNLPGVQVEENGIIKFKGKVIKKLLLDGDDLFDAQYKIGSKNIDVEMVEEVQGIEHYEQNVLLKGISDSDGVALNLVLKKGKIDWSGTINLGYGFEKNFDNAITTLLVNKKIKGFAMVSHNTIGQNNSPYSVENNFKSFEESGENRSEMLINQGNFSSIIDSKWHRINNNFYGTGNTLFKVHEKSTVKFNFGFYDDNITRVNKSDTNFSIDNQELLISERNNLNIKPRLYDAKATYSNQEHANFHWDYAGKINYYKTIFNDFSTNNDLLQNNRVHSQSLFMDQIINATLKLTDSTAIIFKTNYSRSNTPQFMTIFPGTVIDAGNSLISNSQESENKNNVFNFKSSIISRINNYKFGVHTVFTNSESKLNSNLKNVQNNSLGDLYRNDNHYNLKMFSVKPVLIYSKSAFSFKVENDVFYTNFEYNDLIRKIAISLTQLNVAPEVTLNYLLNKNSSLSSSYSYNQVLPNENKLFSGIIQNNYRNFSNNTLSLDFLESHSYNLGYSYNNLYESKRVAVNLSHNFKPNNYFRKTFVNQNITVGNSFLAAMSTKEYSLDFMGETYYHPLRSTFKVSSNFSISYNKNIINNSEIRNVTGNSLFTDFIIRTSLTSKILLESNTLFSRSSFKIDSKETNFENLSNQIKLIFRPNKEVNFKGIANIITPDLSNSYHYFFLETEFNYNPIGKKYGVSLIGKNLTNNKTFETTTVSDFFTSSQSHNLIERYVMLKVFFSF